jgi:prevent-host-death family protein
MNTIGAFEAKTHFSQLLCKVARGETFIITKHGAGIAKLTPLATETIRATPADAIKAILELQKNITLGKKCTLKQLITEGRK